ncbi:hypothetical protein PROFUN_12467 [Planoprotostelium fungivorum]|uniref:2,4-dienoyl-CoA reductase [(3E)-enoyl-CoA-producing] n=1 Tax=Planoprotostelium fungivorum TaxID=1890364 RepID=A0A2P6N7B7_9EUKA|nr:hypothetical protein PROFUN_12467 [Planoprotostelium fungivorum]
MEAAKTFQPGILKGKVALITGGASGINFEIARTLAQFGAAVAIMGRREKVVAAAVEEINKAGGRAIGVPGDVRTAEAAQKVIGEVVSKLGRLDIVVNGAAGNFLCPAEDLSSNAFKTVIEIDLVGTFNVSRAAFPELQKTKGLIINISATLHYSTTPWQTHASAAKAGVDSLTTSLAAEWGHYGIRVNGIAPGPIADTVGMSKLSLGMTNGDNLSDALSQVIPLGRAGLKSDIASAALFLSSDAASFISGHTLVVDGAAWLYHQPAISREGLRKIEEERRKSKL